MTRGSTWGGFRGVAVGDLNKDGVADLVGASRRWPPLRLSRPRNRGSARVLGGAGSGRATWFGFHNRAAIALGDLNGDGIADLAGLADNGHLYIYAGRGNVNVGTAFWSGQDQGGTWGAFTDIALGDLPDDAIADLAALNTNRHMYTYPGRGTTGPPAFWAARDQGVWGAFTRIAL